MARVKRAVNAQKKRREVLERASGYRGQRSRLYRKAKEQVTHSLVYAYRDRRARKGDFRRLWIQRINAAARENGITYNRFIQGLKLAGVEVDRRILADLAVNDAAAFAALVATAKAAVRDTCRVRRHAGRSCGCTPAAWASADRYRAPGGPVPVQPRLRPGAGGAAADRALGAPARAAGSWPRARRRSRRRSRRTWTPSRRRRRRPRALRHRDAAAALPPTSSRPHARAGLEVRLVTARGARRDGRHRRPPRACSPSARSSTSRWSGRARRPARGWSPSSPTSATRATRAPC